METLVKNNFFFVKNLNFGEKSKLWSKIEIWGKIGVLVKNESLVKNLNISQKSRSKIEMLQHVGQKSIFFQFEIGKKSTISRKIFSALTSSSSLD